MQVHVGSLATLLHLATSVTASSVLFRGGTIIAWNATTESLEVLRNTSLLVQDGTIHSMFTGSTSTAVTNDTEIVDASNDIISPGFVDTHRHGWQTAFRTIGSNTSLTEYFGRYGEFASEGRWTANDVYSSQLMGLYEAMNAGVTTVLDHAHHTWSNATSEAGLQASIDSGARVFWSYAFHNLVNFTFAEQVQDFRGIMSAATFQDTPTSVGIAYDGFNPGNPNQTQEVISLLRDYNVSVLTTHSLQGPWGISNSPEDLHALSILNTTTPVVFAHASFISAAGATLLRQTNQYMSITAESEMHYGHDHPVSHLIQDQAALGIDTHFTYSTDLLTQARMWLQYVRLVLYREVLNRWEIPNYTPMTVNQAFLLATRHGGLALRRPDLGVIAPGACADLIVVDGRSPGLIGWVDPVAALVLHSNVGDIKHVLVDGKWKKRNGSLVVNSTDGLQGVQDRFLQTAARIQQIWAETPYPVLEGVFEVSGYPYAQPLQADTLRGNGTGYGGTFVP